MSEFLEAQIVASQVPEALLKTKSAFGENFLCVARDKLRDVVAVLKNDPDLQYAYFSECCGVDYSAWQHDRDFPESRFEVVYNLMSLKRNSRIFVKVGVNDGEKVPSLKPIFLGADYPEKEVWDMLGIVFEGNEQTQRFLMPDDWVGHPLRKEYPLGGEDVLFAQGEYGPAIEDLAVPHAGESFEGKTGTEEVSGR